MRRTNTATKQSPPRLRQSQHADGGGSARGSRRRLRGGRRVESPQLDDSAIEFFRTATTNLLTAEKDAGVAHHVALSVVGTAQLAPQSGYFQAKLLQENLIAEGPIPYTLVHATQLPSMRQ